MTSLKIEIAHLTTAFYHFQVISLIMLNCIPLMKMLMEMLKSVRFFDVFGCGNSFKSEDFPHSTEAL